MTPGNDAAQSQMNLLIRKSTKLAKVIQGKSILKM